MLAYDPSVAFQATGDRGDAFEITNIGSRACEPDGYPGVTMRDRSGQRLPFAYTDGGSQYVTQQPPRPVLLEPGRSAYLGIAKYRCDAVGERVATSLALLVPGQRTTKIVDVEGRTQNLAYCSGGPRDPGNTIAISPVEAQDKRVL